MPASARHKSTRTATRRGSRRYTRSFTRVGKSAVHGRWKAQDLRTASARFFRRRELDFLDQLDDVAIVSDVAGNSSDRPDDVLVFKIVIAVQLDFRLIRDASWPAIVAHDADDLAVELVKARQRTSSQQNVSERAVGIRGEPDLDGQAVIQQVFSRRSGRRHVDVEITFR